MSLSKELEISLRMTLGFYGQIYIPLVVDCGRFSLFEKSSVVHKKHHTPGSCAVLMNCCNELAHRPTLLMVIDLRNMQNDSNKVSAMENLCIVRTSPDDVIISLGGVLVSCLRCHHDRSRPVVYTTTK